MSNKRKGNNKKKRNNKNKNKMNFRNCIYDTICGTIYTPEAVELCYGEEFKTTDPERVEKFRLIATTPDLRITDTVETMMLQGLDIENLAMCVIDEDYFEYLEDYDLEDTGVNRSEYARLMDDETREYLWEKYSFDRRLEVFFIPVHCINSESGLSSGHYLLTKDTINLIKQDIARHNNIPVHNVFVADNAMRADYIDAYWEEIEDYMEYSFLREGDTILPAFMTKQQDFVNSNIRFIPVLIKTNIPSKINVEEYIQSFENRNLGYTFSNDTTSAVKNDFGVERISIPDFLLDGTECAEYLEDFVDTLHSEAKKKGVKIK